MISERTVRQRVASRINSVYALPFLPNFNRSPRDYIEYKIDPSEPPSTFTQSFSYPLKIPLIMATTFHNNVVALRPKVKVKPTTLWVGVLKSHLHPSDLHHEDEFLWIKCHKGVSVGTVLAQYTQKFPAEGSVVLKYGTTIPAQDRTMGQLDELGDRTIAFEAIKVGDLSTRMPADRAPLQPINPQVSIKKEPHSISFAKHEDVIREVAAAPKVPASNENIKPEPGYQSPYGSAYRSVPPPSFPNLNASPPRPTAAWPSPAVANASYSGPLPISTLHPLTASTFNAPNPYGQNNFDASNRPDWATSNGFLLYSDEWRETFKYRNLNLDESKRRSNFLPALDNLLTCHYLQIKFKIFYTKTGGNSPLWNARSTKIPIGTQATLTSSSTQLRLNLR